MVPCSGRGVGWDAYSELTSDRYAGQGISELTKKLDRRVPFDKLKPAERDLLVSKWHEVRGPFFNWYFTSVAAFTVEQWNKSQLGYSFVIPEPFLRELGRPASAIVTFRQWIEAVPKVRLDSGHARYAADGSPPVSMHDHPITIGRLSATSPMVMLEAITALCGFGATMIQQPSLRSTCLLDSATAVLPSSHDATDRCC
jgi:hypothetical protein